VISERADFDERYSYWGQMLRRDVDSTDPARPLIPIEQEPASVAPPEPIVVEQPMENVIPEPQPAEPVLEMPHPAIADEIEQPIALRRTRREIRAPGEWWKVRHPAPVIESDESGDSEEEGAHVVISGEVEPMSYREALGLPLADKWKDACLEEYNWHLQNGTWTLVELLPGMKAIGSKWVFKIKHNADGSIERFKARLVAKGFAQRPGQDYFETFASTMRHTTIRTILALAAIEDMELHSVDISHAFTNSDIDAEVYMRQPEGFEQSGSKYVCRLNKSLYGLKQSPRLE